jgi:hypothetical protein
VTTLYLENASALRVLCRSCLHAPYEPQLQLQCINPIWDYGHALRFWPAEGATALEAAVAVEEVVTKGSALAVEVAAT